MKRVANKSKKQQNSKKFIFIIDHKFSGMEHGK